MIKMSVMRYAKSRNHLLGTILALCADPFKPDSDEIYEMKLQTHPPIATNIQDFGTPTFDFRIKPRKLNISSEANNNLGVDTPDFKPGSDSIMKCYCGGSIQYPQRAMYVMSVRLLEVLFDLIS